MKLRKKCIGILMIFICLFGFTAYAAKDNSIKADIPKEERLFRKNADGSFITVPVNFVEAKATCSHQALEPIGPGEIITYPGAATTSAYCYRTRRKQPARCVYCGKTGFIIYGPYETYPHIYSTTNYCNRCGYKKR